MITKDDLTKSAAVFDEASHTYRLGDEELSGITGLIRSVLLLGTYPDANDYAKNVSIPRAGYFGSCVHRSIQAYEDLGVDLTEFPEMPHPTADTLPAQDVSLELASYKAMKPANMTTIASEFLISYGKFASSVDAVWVDDEDKIYLVDHKTNNLDYYPGGENGLKEYLSWQLSCYAVMFEQQTKLPVAGLRANWLRHGDAKHWEIERKPDADVLNLLSTEIVKTDDGFAYLNTDMQVIAPEVTEVTVATSKDLAVPVDIIDAITALLRAEKAAKKMKDMLREMMEAASITKWECDTFTATIGKASETTTFDSKAFAADHPELYQQYLKTTTRKGSFTQKLK